MTVYKVVLLNENGESIDGELVYLDVHGIQLGSAAVYAGGSDIYDSQIPDGTVLYHAEVPGYKPLTIEKLFETTTFQLAKETPVVKYVLLGGLAVGAIVLLSRFIKF
jgi:hypothetical protein